MGILNDGPFLTWEECERHSAEISSEGTRRFISHYNKHKTRSGDKFLWGEEVEHYMIKFDHEKKKVYLSLEAQKVLNRLKSKDSSSPSRSELTNWMPEVAEYQIESTPTKPHEGLQGVLTIERNMLSRRRHLDGILDKDERGLTLAVFPRVATQGYTWPVCQADPNTSSCRSTMFPYEAESKIRRFKVLLSNIFHRREEKFLTRIPVYRDINTTVPFMDLLDKKSPDEAEAKSDHVHVDYLASDCNSVQVNIQAESLSEARILYDQLAVFAPVMLALTASSPVHRGVLCDDDTRWRLLQSVDYRTRTERSPETSSKEQKLRRHPMSSVEGFLSPGSAQFHDVEIAIDESFYNQLLNSGMDELLARHVAHVYMTPLLVLRELIEDKDNTRNDAFQILYSTAWQTVRLKLPGNEPDNGWKVEFRTMETQPTDFENAAACVFVVLLSRVILHFGLDFRIPISMLDENLERSCKKDAAICERFHFRKHVRPASVKGNNHSLKGATICSGNEYTVLTLHELFQGNDEFDGLMTFFQQYLKDQDIDQSVKDLLSDYISLFYKRASGELLTPAAWIRRFVRAHADYKMDSLVSEAVNYDLILKITQVSQGKHNEESFLPCYISSPLQ